MIHSIDTLSKKKKTEENEILLAIRTTRIFILHNGDWKQIHHHGSIDNPTLKFIKKLCLK
jgi:hypothetical protein